LGINIPIIFTEEFYDGLCKTFKDLSRDISLLTNRIDKVFCYDMPKDCINPYLDMRMNFDKDYSIILRKELIDNLNQEHFSLDDFIKSDVELMLLKINNIRKFVKFYSIGAEELECGNKYSAGSSFRNALKVMKDDITDHLLKKYNC
jgi:hypothetical protein